MTAKTKTAKTFDQLLTLFVQSQKRTMTLAREIADMCIEHFEAHGNLTLAQRFHDAIAENYGRRVAFVKWMASHSPALFEQGKFSKDKSDGAIEFNVEKAKGIAFWDFAPEVKPTVWTGAELIEALNRVIAKHEATAKSKRQPADEIASRTLENAKRVIATLSVPPSAIVTQISEASTDKADAKIEAQVKADLAKPVTNPAMKVA